jgi:hypothetical protein
MAVQRLTLAQIITEILHITGYDSSVNAPWETEANLIRKINMTAQKAVQRGSDTLRAEGKLSRTGVVRHDMWRSTASSTGSSGSGNFVVSAASATVEFPDDLDQFISLWDKTEENWIYPISRSAKERYRRFEMRPAGRTEAVEMLGYGGSNWQRQGKLLPSVASGVTPSMELTYYRLPAIMPGSDTSTEYPDGDYKFHYLWVLEPVLELLRVDDPAYDRYLAKEKELMREFVGTANSTLAAA